MHRCVLERSREGTLVDERSNTSQQPQQQQQQRQQQDLTNTTDSGWSDEVKMALALLTIASEKTEINKSARWDHLSAIQRSYVEVQDDATQTRAREDGKA